MTHCMSHCSAVGGCSPLCAPRTGGEARRASDVLGGGTSPLRLIEAALAFSSASLSALSALRRPGMIIASLRITSTLRQRRTASGRSPSVTSFSSRSASSSGASAAPGGEDGEEGEATADADADAIGEAEADADSEEEAADDAGTATGDSRTPAPAPTGESGASAVPLTLRETDSVPTEAMPAVGSGGQDRTGSPNRSSSSSSFSFLPHPPLPSLASLRRLADQISSEAH